MSKDLPKVMNLNSMPLRKAVTRFLSGHHLSACFI